MDKLDKNVSEIAHIAIAVKNFEEVKKWEIFLDVNKKSFYSSKEQKVEVLILETNGFKLEFMRPLSDDSPISSFLKKNPLGGIHHICFKVQKLQKILESLKEAKIRNITRDKNTKGINQKKICFLNPNDLNNVLVEFEECN